MMGEINEAKLKIIGGVGREELVPVKELAVALAHIQSMSYRAFGYTHYGYKRVHIKDIERRHATIFAQYFRYGSLEVGLVTDALIAMLPVFAGQAVPLLDLIKIAIEYTIAYGKAKLIKGGERPTIEIHANNIYLNGINFPSFAPGLSNATYPAIKGLAKVIDGEKIQEIQFGLNGEMPVIIGDQEKRAILEQEIEIKDDVEIIGRLKKIDVDRKVNGRIELENDKQVPCELVYPDLQWYGQYLDKLLAFHCKPLYRIGVDGSEELERYIVFNARPL